MDTAGRERPASTVITTNNCEHVFIIYVKALILASYLVVFLPKRHLIISPICDFSKCISLVQLIIQQQHSNWTIQLIFLIINFKLLLSVEENVLQAQGRQGGSLKLLFATIQRQIVCAFNSLFSGTLNACAYYTCLLLKKQQKKQKQIQQQQQH